MRMPAITAMPTSPTVNAAAPPQSKSFTSWKMVIVAVVERGVNRKITTESVVTARTNVVTKPTWTDPPSIGRRTSPEPRRPGGPQARAGSADDLAGLAGAAGGG